MECGGATVLKRWLKHICKQRRGADDINVRRIRSSQCLRKLQKSKLNHTKEYSKSRGRFKSKEADLIVNKWRQDD